jgi:hypothetical protein
LGVERVLGGLLVVEIAQHQAGAATADLADLTDRRFDVRIVLAPDLTSYPGQARPQLSVIMAGSSVGSVYWCEQVSVMP